MNNRRMRGYPVFAVIATAIILIITTCGCVQQQPVVNATVNVTPTVTVSVTSTPTIKPSDYSVDDRKFIDAAEVCYRDTPYIENLSTHMAFVTCMKNTPDPTSACAKAYRHNALKYTNEDGTTSGYKRETYNTQLFRDAFFNNKTYNATRQEFEACT